MTKTQAYKTGSIVMTILSAVGVVATAVLTARETPEAEKKLEKIRTDKDRDLTFVETVKTVAPVYAPAIATGIATVSCIIGTKVLDKKSQASLLGAYTLLKKTYEQYKGKVVELYGRDGHRDIIRKIEESDEQNASKVTDVYRGGELESLDPGDSNEEKVLFYDKYSRRYFNSTVSNVLRAEYYTNRDLALDCIVTVNRFYSYLGIDPISDGDQYAWSMADEICWIDFDHPKTARDAEIDCRIIDFSVDPCFYIEVPAGCNILPESTR